MASQREQWLEQLQTGFFPDNSFLQYLKNWGVDNSARMAHIPSDLDLPTAEIDRATRPMAAPIYLSTEDTMFPIREISTQATKVDVRKSMEVNYNELQSVVDRHKNQLSRMLHDYILYRMLDNVTRQPNANHKGQADPPAVSTPFPVGNIQLTTGLGDSYRGTTGLRKKMLAKDWVSMDEMFNDNDVPESNRFAIVPVRMKKDFFDMVQASSKDYVEKGIFPTGIVRQFMGFNIVFRSSVPCFDNLGVLKPLNINSRMLPSGTDRMGVIFFHSDAFAWSMAGKPDFISVANPRELTRNETVALTFAGGGRVIDNGMGLLLQDNA